MSEEQMNDSKFSRYFVAMLLLMVVLTGILMFLASINASEVNENIQAEKDAAKIPNIVKQIAPIGKVNISKETIAATASTSPEAQAEEVNGESVYNSACAACHGAGIAGAPMVGKADQWTARINKGTDTLYASAINGIGAMPARGGQSLSDEQVQAAVDYMVNASQ